MTTAGNACGNSAGYRVEWDFECECHTPNNQPENVCEEHTQILREKNSRYLGKKSGGSFTCKMCGSTVRMKRVSSL